MRKQYTYQRNKPVIDRTTVLEEVVNDTSTACEKSIKCEIKTETSATNQHI